MRYLRLLLSLSLCIPLGALLGWLATSSDAAGAVAGGVVGAFFGLAFGGVKWVGRLFGPDDPNAEK